MHTENAIHIDAPADLVFRLAADIEQWPRLLAHYRSVRKVGESGSSAFARGPIYFMEATRSGYPCRWTSIQELDRPGAKILYHHVAGATKGMDVAWRIEQDAGLTRAIIDHDLRPEWLWLKPFPIRWVVATQFVMHIAQNTLRGIKEHAEAVHASTGTAP
ncbi:MAG: hypothetical protein NVS2B16_29440 [Chloroflexota bacterium]